MGLFSFFKRKPEEPRPAPASGTGPFEATLSEDNYRLLELLPSANRNYIKKQLTEDDTFSRWPQLEEVISGDDPAVNDPYPTYSQKIRTGDIEQLLLEAGLQETPHIRTAGKTAGYDLTRLKAFRLPHLAVFFETQDDLVRHAWLDIDPQLPSEAIEPTARLLYLLGERLDLVLADWNLIELLDLNNKTDIIAYLSEL